MPDGLRKCRMQDEPAYFHGVFQYATPVPPSIMVRGDPGGQIAYPVAVVETLLGKLHAVTLSDVTFEEWEENDNA